MKLEFLSEGSPNCPVIRLYSFTRLALHLKEVIDQLAHGILRELKLPEEPGVEPLDECDLLLRLGIRDQGIIQFAPLWFECVLSDEGWLDVSGLSAPFCETDTRGFQWLVSKGPIELLISADGGW